MRLLFLQPLRIYKRWPMPEDFTGLVGSVPTLAFPQLAGALPGHQFDHLDGLVRTWSLRELATRASRADAVLINAHSSIGSRNVEANLDFLNQRLPGKPIVIGGHHATMYEQEWLEKGAHFVVRHEGEETIRELVEALGRGGPYDGIAGLSWRSGSGRPVRNPDRPLVASLDRLPFPDWTVVDHSHYRLPFPVEGYAASLETSRGCSRRCSFCTTSHMWKGTHRFKSAERVLEELRALQRRGVGKLWISDDNFGVRPERDREIYEGVLKEKMRFNWACMIRADSIHKDPETIALSARAGFKMAFVGFESPVPRVMGEFRKEVDPDAHAETAQILRRNGVFVVGFFVVGYPGETEAETEAVFKAARKLSDYPIISIFEPRRGSDAYDRCAEHEDMPSDDMFYHNTVDFIPSQRHLLKRYRKFFSRYLRHPGQLRKLTFGTPVQRTFYRFLYANMTRSVLTVSPAKVVNPWKMVKVLR